MAEIRIANNITIRQLLADGAVAARVAVTYGSDDGQAAQCGANGLGLGVSVAAAADGDVVEFVPIGLHYAKAGGDWSRGARLKSDLNGALVEISTTLGEDAQNVVAFALEDATSGQYRRVLILPHQIDLDAALKTALASTASGSGASLISIEDSGGNYTATDLEAVLAEIAGDVSDLATLLASTSNGEGAALIGVEDSADNFTGATVEAVLAELAAKEQDFVVEFDLDRYLAQAFPSDITSSQGSLLAFVAHRALQIRNVILSLENTGEDAANPLSLAADVQIGGTSCLTTQPAIDKSAADGANTAAAGTGITQAAIDTDNDDAAAGDRVTVDLTLTRTASPTDEMAGARVIIVGSYRLPY